MTLRANNAFWKHLPLGWVLSCTSHFGWQSPLPQTFWLADTSKQPKGSVRASEMMCFCTLTRLHAAYREQPEYASNSSLALVHLEAGSPRCRLGFNPSGAHSGTLRLWRSIPRSLIAGVQGEELLSIEVHSVCRSHIPVFDTLTFNMCWGFTESGVEGNSDMLPVAAQPRSWNSLGNRVGGVLHTLLAVFFWHFCIIDVRSMQCGPGTSVVLDDYGSESAADILVSCFVGVTALFVPDVTELCQYHDLKSLVASKQMRKLVKVNRKAFQAATVCGDGPAKLVRLSGKGLAYMHEPGTKHVHCYAVAGWQHNEVTGFLVADFHHTTTQSRQRSCSANLRP
jgi:hypothetical protein